MERFKVVGMGPGGLDYIIPAAFKAIEQADVLAGAPRQIEMAEKEILRSKKETFLYRANLSELIDYLQANRNKRIAVLVTGDPGFHSLLGVISRSFSPEEYEVIPGISSFQSAMACLGKPWQADYLCSCHGKDFQEIQKAALKALRSGRRIILLTDARRSPSYIARELLKLEIGNRRVWLGENLTLPDEDWTACNLEETAQSGKDGRDDSYSLCVMIVE